MSALPPLTVQPARITYPTGKTLLQGRPYTPASETDVRCWAWPAEPLYGLAARRKTNDAMNKAAWAAMARVALAAPLPATAPRSNCK